MEKITALNKQLETNFNSNDLHKVAALYLDSAVIMRGGLNITGRTDLDNYWMSLKHKRG